MVWLNNHISNRIDRNIERDTNAAPYMQQFAITVEGFKKCESIESEMSDFYFFNRKELLFFCRFRRLRSLCKKRANFKKRCCN